MSDAEVRAARGAASLYFASVLSLLLNTFYLVLLTNILPQEQVGVVALLNVLVIGIATAAAMGIPVVGAGLSATPPAVARFLSEYVAGGNGRAARRLLLISLVICAVISSTLALLLTQRATESYLSVPATPALYAAFDAVFFAFGQVGVYSLIGTGGAGRAGVVLTVSALLRYLAASVLLFAGFGAAGIFQGFIVGDLFLVVASLVLVGRGLPPTGSPRTYSGLYPYMLSVLVSGLIGFGVSQSDRLIAFFQTGLGNLAVYNIAAVGASVAAFAPIAVTNALVPILPSLGAAGSEARKTMMKNYTRYVSLVAMPAGFGLAGISPLLLLVFGPQYVQGAPLVAVMAVAIGVTAIGSVYASGLLASGKTYLFLVGNALALVCLIAVSYVLIPVEGLLGIAIARAGMLLVSLAAFALFSRTQRELVIDLRGYLSSLVSSVAMFGAIYAAVLLATPHLATRTESVAFSFVMMPAGLAVFILVMWAIDGFAEEDFVFLERLLPRFLTPLISLLRRTFLKKDRSLLKSSAGARDGK